MLAVLRTGRDRSVLEPAAVSVKPLAIPLACEACAGVEIHRFSSADSATEGFQVQFDCCVVMLAH